MTGFNQATEMVLALSSLLKELQQEMESQSEYPSDRNDNIDSYQVFMSQLILLQKEVESFIEDAVTMELSFQDLPVQILDFSSEWDRFK
ncbi:MAG: hypothetical protein GF388_04255 [Candidatus Aegiribacteria sp.]|nr:hypothetical protein [Candidatus Aegiribacteria sp.]MBD3294451.1 hypothetical protein [Candidatus Fermentibacteria bacterium]